MGGLLIRLFAWLFKGSLKAFLYDVYIYILYIRVRVFFLNGLVHLLGAWTDLGLAPGGGIVRSGGGGTQSCEVKNTSKIGFQNATGSSSGPCKVPELRIELAVPKFHAEGHEIGLKAWIDICFFSFKHNVKKLQTLLETCQKYCKNVQISSKTIQTISKNTISVSCLVLPPAFCFY